jgi:hypothetical protein
MEQLMMNPIAVIIILKMMHLSILRRNSRCKLDHLKRYKSLIYMHINKRLKRSINKAIKNYKEHMNKILYLIKSICASYMLMRNIDIIVKSAETLFVQNVYLVTGTIHLYLQIFKVKFHLINHL